jgi:hypothetical protein
MVTCFGRQCCVLATLIVLQPKEPKESDESGAFARLNSEDDAATDGDRRHLLQKTDPKEPKEVCCCTCMLACIAMHAMPS